MDVVMVTDEAYAPWCATTIVSVGQACGAGRVRIHVLHPEAMSAEARRRLVVSGDDHGVEVLCQVIDETSIAMLPTKGPALGGRMSWVRVALPSALPELDRVIYLDADTYVVQPLDELWELALDEAPIAAVTNVTDESMHDHLASLGVHRAADYFNAGILVMDLERWRDDAVPDALVRFVVERQLPLPWFDQDAMNAVFAGGWHRLHPRWNTMNSFWTWQPLADALLGADAVQQAKDDPAVLHFEGPGISKPWHYLCPHPWRDAYRSALGRTPWRAVPLVERTIGTRLVGLLPSEQWIPAYRRLVRARNRITRVRTPHGHA
jgi:lipopolysaccharide biosynthesis glycosyltransferase